MKKQKRSDGIKSAYFIIPVVAIVAIFVIGAFAISYFNNPLSEEIGKLGMLMTAGPVSGASGTGSISATSTPSGVSVQLDTQQMYSSTPWTYTGVTPGTHTVKFMDPNYPDYSTTVTVTAGVTTSVSPKWTPIKGSISATSTPSYASVYIDGVIQGKSTPSTYKGIAPGTHTVKFTKAGYPDYVISNVVVIGGQTTTVSAIFNTGIISATSTPTGATVLVDGVTKGVTPSTSSLTITGVTLGSHSVKFTKSGYTDVTQSATISTNGQNVPVSATLNPISTICTDSDKGLVYTLIGTTSNTTISKTDSCNGMNLTEYICSGNDVAARVYPCESGGYTSCSNGACIK